MRLIFILVLMGLVVTYLNKQVMPGVVHMSQMKSETLINEYVYAAVDKVFDENVSYENLMIIEKDYEGRPLSLQSNYPVMNKLASQISEDIRQNISGLQDDTVTIPLGMLSGIPLLSSSGPDVKVNVKLLGSVHTDFKSEFNNIGANQTQHKIILEVKTKIAVTAPLMDKVTEVKTCIPVAETIIIGSMPELEMELY